MGNCCSDVAGGRAAIGGTAGGLLNPADSPNDAVDNFLRSRGYHGLFSQIEVLTLFPPSLSLPNFFYYATTSIIRIILSFSASGLRDRDVLSKVDDNGLPEYPYSSIPRSSNMTGQCFWSFLGESISLLLWDNPSMNGRVRNSNTVDAIRVAISPLTVTQKLECNHGRPCIPPFRVYDVDTQFHNADVKMLKLEEQQFLGEATCALSEIITKPDRSLTLDLHREDTIRSSHSQNCGKLLVHAEECVNSKTTVEMILRCSDLEYRDLFSKSDPFLLVSKVVEGGTNIPICKTEVIKNDHNPTWKPLFLNIQQIGSKESPLIIECYNFNSNGKHDLMGKVQRSLVELEKLYSGGQGESLFLPATVGHNSHNKVLKSRLFVDKFAESVQYTFLDYLGGGFELNFMVAIDFTASNGNPRLPDSLHYIDPSGRPNAYQRAIVEVGEVLQFYDSDKRFPTWGFGARPIDGPVSHCFNLNGSSHYCEVEGIQGIMMAYTSALLNVSLAGPTLFGPVISNAALIASQSVANGGRKYFVLLIITDGVVTDLQETKDALVKASDLPLSILIVGVGGADFKEMEILDADKGDRLESSSGRVASRDIVQFVPFRDVQSRGQEGFISELPYPDICPIKPSG
ncbi:von Willebrand factor, type A [Sesbania bispinosa]|nr:von Willebrand factor, type A [Sesbania bispinosa]